MTSKDLTGTKIGNLTVLSFAGRAKNGRLQWLCECSCGKQLFILQQALVIKNNQKSCGCLPAKNEHGMSFTSEYKAYRQMITRCEDTNKIGKNYKHYGGRGIKVCDRWLASFKNFFEDMGLKPTKKHSLDRINNNLGYSPDNCRWATLVEQARNKTINRKIVVDGKEILLIDYAEVIGIAFGTLAHRYRKGLRGADLISPTDKSKVRIKKPIALYETEAGLLSLGKACKVLNLNESTVRARLAAGWDKTKLFTK